MKKTAIFAAAIFAVSLFAESFTYTEYIPVYKSEQNYRIITKREPYQECWDEEVPVSQSSGDETAGALIGGAAGGIIGHQVGKGGGKTAATIGGAILGTIIGSNLAKREPEPGYKIVRRCRTRYKETHERIIEYKNYANFNGQEIIKYSSRPLDRIRVRVTVEY